MATMKEYLNKALNEKIKVNEVNEGKEGMYNISFGINFSIYSNSMKKAEKIAEKYCKTIKTKEKDKVLNIEWEASDEPN